MKIEEYFFEIWKPVYGYEGWYEVSNFGRVRSLDRTIVQRNGVAITAKGQLMWQRKRKDNYFEVKLGKRNNRKAFLVHRLVAIAFIPNPNNFKYVNHIDENRGNNCVWNLEWCTFDYNIHYGTGMKRSAMHRINNPKIWRAIICTETNIIYPSINEINRQFGYNISCICECCKGKRKTAYGHHWQYVDTKEDAN